MEVREKGLNAELALQDPIEGTALIYAGRQSLALEAEAKRFSFGTRFPEPLARIVSRVAGAIDSGEFDAHNEVLVEGLSVDELQLVRSALEGLCTQESIGRRIKEFAIVRVYENPEIERQLMISATAKDMADKISGFVASQEY